MSEFQWPVRVYYEDTDSGGVVYYANYLKFMERARSEWLRSLGVEQDELIARDSVIFAVRSAQMEFLSPGRFNDLLHVSARVIWRGRASLTFEQKISRADQGESPLCIGSIKIACLNATTLRPCPIPGYILEKIPYGDVQ
ncbi:MAG: tol-pal system-associated acyl-CoA thioesterase [Gammaproteobacteria bacterium]